MINNALDRVKLMALCMQRYPWEQGVLAQAFLESGDDDTAIALAAEAAHRQLPDGRPAMMEGSGTVTDPCSVGEALVFAHERTGDEMFKRSIELLKDWISSGAPSHSDGTLYHVIDKPEFWVDSFYMLPPCLVALGQPDEALRQLDGYWNALYMEELGLLGHIRNMRTGEWVRRAAWGVGNGWAMAGMARVIEHLPPVCADGRVKLIKRVGLLLDSALPLMRPDGLFHDVLNDPASFVETNFPQMMAYTIFTGVKSGWLPGSYLEHANKMRSAAQGKVDAYGQVQGVCGAPTFDLPGCATEGQAFYILMEAAAKRIG